MPDPAGRRPVVLISRDSSYAVRSSITIVEVSRTIRSIPTEVPLGKREGLSVKCVVNADNVVTIPKAWLEARVGALSPDKVAALNDAIKFALALP
jgi:mRNA-degrading endonuclease toxin of MazEF toxin-antitoxin module